MKRKGFTLIELLGVIVVLAIIALIAVPTIIGIVDKARKNSLRNSGYGLIEAGTLYYLEKQNTRTIRFDIHDNEITSKEKLNYKGSIKEGTVLINNKGEVVVCINDGKYAAYKNFKDNKVIVVDNRTCNIPENSSIVYLDNEATIDIDVTELLSKMEIMEKRITELEQEKSNRVDVTNAINNLTNAYNTDITNVNSRLESIIQIINTKNKFHEINVDIDVTSTTNLTYTGANTIIPVNSYYCLTAITDWWNGAPKQIAIVTSDSIIENSTLVSQNSSDLNMYTLSTTTCGKTKQDTVFYVWESHSNDGINNMRLIGFYVN